MVGNDKEHTSRYNLNQTQKIYNEGIIYKLNLTKEVEVILILKGNWNFLLKVFRNRRFQL